MSVYSKLVNYFQGTKIEPIELPIEPEEKAINFGACLPGVSDGRMYYAYLNSLDNAYSTNYIIHKCINILAYNLSKIPLRISKNGEPLPIDVTLKGGFDIRQPHPRMSLSKLLYECSVYYWYKGEFMTLIDDETPFSLEPIDPDLMRIDSAEGRMITSWKFNNKDTILEQQLIYANMMNPEITNAGRITDEERALSLVEVVKKELINYTSGRDFNTQFFGNFAQLGLTLTDVNGATSREDRQAIANTIDNKLSNGKAWKTRVLPQGLDIADTKNLSMREMEFSQSLKDIRDIILSIFGVPRSVFGITNESGLAQNTVDVEKRIMWTDTIQPAAHMVQEAFNQTLMKNHFPGYKLFFDYSVVDVLQDNMSDKAELALKYQNLGYTTEEINNILDLGMEETTDTRMNERFHPQSLLPYSEIEADLSEPTKQVDDKIDKIVELMEEEENKSVRSQRYRNRFNRAQRKTEKELASKLGGYFAKQLGKVLALVKEEKNIKDINETLLLSDLLNLMNEEKEVLSNILEPVYTDGTMRGSTLALNTLKSDAVPMASEAVVKSLTNEIRTINNHTYRLLRTQIKDSINAGESVADMTKRVQQVYKFNKSRARTIARTESLKVMSRSTDVEYRKAGVKRKEWLSSPGARDSHAACSAQGAIDYDATFINGLRYPGDTGPASEVCNCRCALAPVVEA